jgi:hypothetical protein
VVGGGDSAVEGAIALAEVGASVTLSYRGDGFKRCKQGNQKRLAEMVASRQLAVLLESNVKCFTPDSVTITLADKSEAAIANQRAFVLIGADTPVAWLETNHVRFVERPHLYALGSSEDVVRRFAPDAVQCPHTPDEALAILLDRPAPRSSVRRVRSVVDHLRDELREVVTSVSSAFRLSDLEPPRDHRRALTRTPARGVAAIRAGSQVVPTSRLTAGSPATGPTPRGGVPRSRQFTSEQTMIGPAPILPRSARRRTGAVGDTTLPLPAIGGERTTVAVPSLRALERAAGLAGRPLPSPTDEMTSLRRAGDEPTDETASLRALEQRTQQLDLLRRTGAVQHAGWIGGADDGKTEEVASLRALERSTAHDAATLDVQSLRALERSATRDIATRDIATRDIATRDIATHDSATPEMQSQRALERSSVHDSVTEDMRSLRALERTTVADGLSLRALDGSLDTEVVPLHTLDQTAAIAAASSDWSSSVLTSATRPVALPVRPSAPPPPLPRFARGSEGVVKPPTALSEPHQAPTPERRAQGSEPHRAPAPERRAQISEPHRAPTPERRAQGSEPHRAPAPERRAHAEPPPAPDRHAHAEPRRAPAPDRREVTPSAGRAPSVLPPAPRVALPMRPGAVPPPLPQRPSRLPRGSALVRQRLTPTPTLQRRDPVSAAPVPHDGDRPLVRPTRGTR